MEIYKDITFEGSAPLPNLPDGHKCRGFMGILFCVTLDGPG
ncbi:MAG: hypothetical protein Ct9H90mP20_0100 [Candidatus Neomarinimicrobiota bacterium]|nr:MAG: hypothetical protein Ct9H90mP20_0100 [Candidatus Neomarinimicrobiota bacterium]